MSDTSTEIEQAAGKRRRFTVDALFADTTPRAVGVRDLPNAKEIELDRIQADPTQPRRSFDEERLDELAASIRQEGVLQPIAVRYDRDGGDYIVLHGERRWRAAQRAGLTTIPAVVRDVPEERRLLQQLMENVVREDLNAIDRATALRALKAQMGDAPWERVAEAVGIRRSRLFQLLGTEKLADEVQDQLRAGRLSEKQSRVLQGLPQAAQEALARLIVDDELSAAAARELAQAARDDEDFITMSPDDAHARFVELRGRVTPAPSRGRQRDARRPLERLLGRDGAAAALQHEPVDADDIHGRITCLAKALATLDAEPHAELDLRLRAMRSLIDALLS